MGQIKSTEDDRTLFDSTQQEEKMTFQELNIPSEILNMDEHAISIYKSALENGKEKVFNTRIMLVGPTGAGKTTLTKRLLQLDFKMKATESTNGIDIHIQKCGVDISDKQWIINQATQLQTDIYNNRLSRVLKKEDEKKNSGTVETKTTEGDENISTAELQKPSNDSTFKSESQHQTTTASITLSHLEELVGYIKNNPHKLDQDIGEISIWDFGGQFTFYSTHQAFLSPRAIYLLVMDITKGWKDLVEEDGCFVDVSGLEYLKLGDYIIFWLNSIHTYGNSSDDQNYPPVILCATHIDDLQGDRELQIRKFFCDIRIGLSQNEAIFRHLADTDFAIDNSIQDPHLNDLKNKIIEIASRQKYWGEEIPATWIVLEKALSHEKVRGVKILSLDKVLAINESTVKQLTGKEEVQVFLKFHNDLGNLIYYDEENLHEFIILDPQWLANAFKCLITTDIFYPKTLLEVGELNKLNKHGYLSQNLADTLWKKADDTTFYEHRYYVLRLMEKMDIIARPVHEPLSECSKEFEYFVPCLLKDTLDKEFLSYIFEEADKTSYFCLVFQNNFIPPAIFHRLVSSFVSKWPIASKRKKRLIFCGCAVFELDKRNQLILCMYGNIIQISVYRFDKSLPDPEICIPVKTSLKDALQRIIKRFNQSVPWVDHIKCDKSLSKLTSREGLVPVDELLSSGNIICHDHEILPNHLVDRLQLLECWFDDKVIKDFQKADGFLTDQKLFYVATKLGVEWSEIALNLGLSLQEIEQIKLDNPNQTVQQTTTALVKWRERQRNKSKEVILNILLKTLKDCGRADLMHELQEQLRDSDIATE